VAFICTLSIAGDEDAHSCAEAFAQGRVTDPLPTCRDAAEPTSRAESLEDGSLDPDELDGEPAWWDEGSDDET
jgi:hypothetical protein